MEIRKNLLAIATIACLGLGTAFAQEATSIPGTLSVAPNSVTSDTASAQGPATNNLAEPEVSDLTSATRNLINALFFAKTAFECENPASMVHSEIDQKYPGAKLADIKDIDAAYETNEIKANKNYKNKWVWMIGEVKKISDSADQGPSAVLLEPNEQESAIALFANHDAAREVLGDLDAGDFLSLMCQGAGFENGMAKFNNCRFFNALDLKAFETLRLQFLAAMEHKGNATDDAPYVFTVLMLGEIMGDQVKQDCEKSMLHCIMGIVKRANGKEPNFDNAIKEATKQFEALGYDPQLLKDNPTFKQKMEEIGTFFAFK